MLGTVGVAVFLVLLGTLSPTGVSESPRPKSTTVPPWGYMKNPIKVSAAQRQSSATSAEVDFLEALQSLRIQSRAEHIEQIRDWLRLATAARLDAPQAGLRTVTGVMSDQAAIRLPELGNAIMEQHGATRTFVRVADGTTTLHVLVSSDETAKHPDQVGTAYARHVALTGRLPDVVQLHTYRIQLDLAWASVADRTPMKSRSAERWFGGLDRFSVRDANGLAALLAKDPDLVGARCTDDGLKVIARIDGAAGASISIGQIAPLHDPPTDIAPGGARILRTPAFSLDPVDDDVRSLSRRLRRLARVEGLKQRIETALNGSLSVDDLSRRDRFRLFRNVRTNLETFAISAKNLRSRHRFLSYLDELSGETPRDSIPGIVSLRLGRDAARDTGYQCARYEGGLKGTETGMLFFYSDLLAKLWSLDYLGHTPVGQIAGLSPIPGHPASPDFCTDRGSTASTRIWFGLRSEAVRPYEDGASVYFDRRVVRVFAKTRTSAESSEQVESVPLDTARFIRWFNEYYEAVARTESAYESLNQLMKWSALMHWASDQPACSKSFEFLSNVPADDSLRFDTWAEQHDANLTYPAADLPKLLRTKNPGAECLAFVSSRPWQTCGREATLSGGVVAPNRRDVRALDRASMSQGPPEATYLAPFVQRSTGNTVTMSSGPDGAARRTFVLGSNRRTIIDRIDPMAMVRGLLGTLKQGQMYKRVVHRVSRQEIRVKQSVDNVPRGSVSVVGADAPWRKTWVKATSDAPTSDADFVETLNSSPEDSRGAYFASSLRAANPGLVVVANGRNGAFVRNPGTQHFVELHRARGPPKGSPNSRWRSKALPNQSIPFLYWRSATLSKSKALAKKQSTAEGHSIPADAQNPELARLREAERANDAEMIARIAERLITAPARGPPDRIAAEEVASTAVRRARVGDAEGARLLRRAARRLKQARHSGRRYQVPGNFQGDEYVVTGHANIVEPFQIMSNGTVFDVQSFVAKDGLKGLPRRYQQDRVAISLLVPSTKDQEFPEFELFTMHVPLTVQGEVPDIRAGPHRATPLRYNRTAIHRRDGISARKPLGRRGLNRYDGRRVSWSGLLLGEDRTMAHVAMLRSCDEDGNGTVGEAEWCTCRCDANFDGALTSQAETACNDAAIAWLSKKRRAPRRHDWAFRRCGPGGRPASAGCLALVAPRLSERRGAR